MISKVVKLNHIERLTTEPLFRSRANSFRVREWSASLAFRMWSVFILNRCTESTATINNISADQSSMVASQ